jgi:predicted GNAT family acetyltransferase
LSDPAIRRESEATKGRLVLSRDGAEAELTWSVASPTRVIADHTEVPEALRGTGAGKLLVERLVADARADGVTIIALCPFVRSQAARHPEWPDFFV